MIRNVENISLSETDIQKRFGLPLQIDDDEGVQENLESLATELHPSEQSISYTSESDIPNITPLLFQKNRSLEEAEQLLHLSKLKPLIRGVEKTNQSETEIQKTLLSAQNMKVDESSIELYPMMNDSPTLMMPSSTPSTAAVGGGGVKTPPGSKGASIPNKEKEKEEKTKKEKEERERKEKEKKEKEKQEKE
ncbi:hypothetical protein RFI_38949, partial [Reticulomyxa filosa]